MELMKLILPAILQPISRKKDKSCVLKFETRELNPTELMQLLPLEGTEGWLTYQPNQEKIEMPTENAVTSDLKTPSQRLKNALYRVYLQETTKGTYVGVFDNYYKEKVEKYIQHTLGKLDE